MGRIVELCGADPSLIEFVTDRPGHDRRYSLSSEKLRDLGWEAQTRFDEGLDRTVQWYRDNAWWWEPIRSGVYREYYERQYGRGAETLTLAASGAGSDRLPALSPAGGVAQAGRRAKSAPPSGTSSTGVGRCRDSAIRSARVLVLGLAPAAHGGNRTGRIFTGDRSGDWLFAALYRTGFANQPQSGLTRRRTDAAHDCCSVTASVRCAPPANRPLPAGSADNCLPYLERELTRCCRPVRVIVCLGGFAWDVALRAAAALGAAIPRPRPRFGHGASAEIAQVGAAGVLPAVCEAITGRLTRPMLDAVEQAKSLSARSHLSA